MASSSAQRSTLLLQSNALFEKMSFATKNNNYLEFVKECKRATKHNRKEYFST